MTTYVQRCLIVPAAYAPLARALCDGLAPGGSGAGMLATPISINGDMPATHFIAQGMIEDTFAALLPLTSFDAEGVPVTVPGQPETIVTLADGSVTLAQARALLAAIDVTEQQPFAAIARKGLKLVQAALA